MERHQDRWLYRGVVRCTQSSMAVRTARPDKGSPVKRQSETYRRRPQEQPVLPAGACHGRTSRPLGHLPNTAEPRASLIPVPLLPLLPVVLITLFLIVCIAEDPCSRSSRRDSRKYPSRRPCRTPSRCRASVVLRAREDDLKDDNFIVIVSRHGSRHGTASPLPLPFNGPPPVKVATSPAPFPRAPTEAATALPFPLLDGAPLGPVTTWPTPAPCPPSEADTALTLPLAATVWAPDAPSGTASAAKAAITTARPWSLYACLMPCSLHRPYHAAQRPPCPSGQGCSCGTHPNTAWRRPTVAS